MKGSDYEKLLGDMFKVNSIVQEKIKHLNKVNKQQVDSF